MSATRSLQLMPDVDFEDRTGGILKTREAEIINRDNQVRAVLDLYFTWEKHRSARAAVAQNIYCPCEMDFDRDEINPTEIRVLLAGQHEEQTFLFGNSLEVFFQIFRVTYVFSAKVIAVAGDSKIEGWHLILEYPNELTLIKSRSLPRFILNDEQKKILPPIIWRSRRGEADVRLDIVEIGLGTLRATHSMQIHKDGFFRFGNRDFFGSILKSEKEGSVFILDLKDWQDYGAYFDIYRLIAYPSLKSRYELPNEAGIDLYRRANYLARSDVSLDQSSGEILKTWDLIQDGVHNTNVDYYIMDNQGVPTGSSGLALTHFSNETPMWSFHQLCAVKEPTLVSLSGVLYTWRAEYLAGRNEELKSWVMFRSASRWVERIYVKYAMSSIEGVKLIPMKMQRTSVCSNDDKSIEIRKYEMGQATRCSTISEEYFGGIGPKFLNASNYVDILISVSKQFGREFLESIAGQIARAAGVDQVPFIYALNLDEDASKFGGHTLVSDRYCEFDKVKLNNFVTAVEHSIAVTERKLENERLV